MNEKAASESKQDKNLPRGRAISLFEIVQGMVEHPEVMADFCFEKIPMQPLELHAGVETKKKKSQQHAVQDGTDTSCKVISSVEG